MIERKTKWADISLDVEDFNYLLAKALCWPKYLTDVEIEVKYKESSGFAGGWFNPPEEKEIEIQYYTILKAEYGNLTEKQASIVEQIIINYFEESLNDILYDRINSDI